MAWLCDCDTDINTINFSSIYFLYFKIHFLKLIRIILFNKLFNRNFSLIFKHINFIIIILFINFFLILFNSFLIVRARLFWRVFCLISVSIIIFLRFTSFTGNISHFFPYLLGQFIKLFSIKFFLPCLYFCLCSRQLTLNPVILIAFNILKSKYFNLAELCQDSIKLILLCLLIEVLFINILFSFGVFGCLSVCIIFCCSKCCFKYTNRLFRFFSSLLRFKIIVCSSCLLLKQIMNGLFLEEGSCKVSPFNGKISKQPFLIGFLENIFLYSPLTYKPVDVDISSLSNTMASVLSLSIHSWIPVRIIENNCISSCKIYSNTTRSCRQYKNKILRIVVKSFHKSLAHLNLGGTIQPHVYIAMVVQEGL